MYKLFCTRQFIYQQIIFDSQEDRLSAIAIAIAIAQPSQPGQSAASISCSPRW